MDAKPPFFSTITEAIEGVCCRTPSSLQLDVPHIAVDEANSMMVEGLRSKIKEALAADSLGLEAETFQEVEKEVESHLDPLTLLRFALARPNSLEAAADMFLKSMQWRQRRNLSHLYLTLHPSSWSSNHGSPKVALANAHFYGGLVGKTRDGYPLFVERLGRLDLDGVARVPEAREAVVDAYTCHLEGIFRVVRACTAVEGRVVRALLVVDLAGAGWSSLRHVSILQGNSKIAVDNYPELYAPILIVNAPAWIAGAWSLFRPLIPAETRRKISIVSSAATLAALEQHVAPEHIPDFLGGQSSAQMALPPFPRAEAVSRAAK